MSNEQPISKLIGRHGHIKLGGMLVFVKIVAIRFQKGVTGFIVTPHGGEGRRWVSPKNINITLM